jgi:hypothetical protein
MVVMICEGQRLDTDLHRLHRFGAKAKDLTTDLHGGTRIKVGIESERISILKDVFIF